MNPENFLLLVLTAVLVDSTIAVLKKSPPFILAPFVRLWKETAFLQSVVANEDYARWRPSNGEYVALSAIKAQTEKKENPQPVLDLLFSSLKRNEPVVLLGEPGAGKTTALEALTYRIAKTAYRYDIAVWFGLLSVAAILLLYAPTASLVWLMSFFLWEALVRRTMVPIFIRARSYNSSSFEEWCGDLLKETLGRKPLLASTYRVIFLVDGVNEVPTNFYGGFLEGWRALLKSRKHRQVIFASRAREEDPSLRLGVGNTLTVQPLDDIGVKEFLRVFEPKKAKQPGQPPFKPEQIQHDFDDLQKKRLFG